MKTIKVICLLLAITIIAGCSTTPKEISGNSENKTNRQEKNEMENNQPKLVTIQIHQEEFEFLGIENKLNPTGQSDFGYFWDNFFKLGGYDNIDPYTVDSIDTNIWYTNNAGEKIYFQGKIVKNVDKVAEGYTLKKFPASDFLILTHEWQPTFTEAQKYIGFGRNHIETVKIPDGYERYDGPGCPITEVERDNANTPNGSRIEHWLPIKKIAK